MPTAVQHPVAPHPSKHPPPPFQLSMPPKSAHHFPPSPHPARNPIDPALLPRLSPAFVDLYNTQIAPHTAGTTDINIVRQNFSSLYRYATQAASGVGGIGETVVPGWNQYPGEINVRVYVPPGDLEQNGGERKVWPVHFNFHGGGWAAGDLETDAHICHHICAHTPCCVIDIEYRLIPEHPFPIGIMDAFTAVTHILTNHKTFSIDPDNVTLGGESSGATIALVLNHLFRDAGMADRIKGVIVGTPTISDVRKYATPDMSPWESMREFQAGPLLDWERLKWFDTFKWMSLASHAGNTSSKEKKADVKWFADIMQAPKFEELAPLTWVGTAEIDPLRDEAEAYMESVRAAGNTAVLKRYKGMPHGFVHMDGVLEEGREFVRDVIGRVRECLYGAEQEVNDKDEDQSEEKMQVDEK